MKFLLAILVGLATILSADALKCYSGSLGAGTNVTDITKLQQLECQATNGQPFCKKETSVSAYANFQSYQNPYPTTRSCDSSLIYNEANQPLQMGQCFNKTYTQGTTMICICNTDLCNSSNNVRASIVVVFSIALWNLFKTD